MIGMEVTMKIPILIAIASSACMPAAPDHDITSRAFLGRSQSETYVRLAVPEAARVIDELFSKRGFALVDQKATATGVQLAFKGHRADIALRHHSTDVGSAFYASLDATDRGVHVQLLGKPTVDGDEASELGGSTYFQTTGANEAEVVHGVLAELQLQGLVAPGVNPHQACLDERAEVVSRANRIGDAAERARVLETAPRCDS
ncbi:MAG TPA: hypothetical protein VGO00_22760 [Kofleriaceae bacterium]|jgi:hypothetical protein|nr:hypothetical protein [Kofleriaceae bacterium]